MPDTDNGQTDEKGNVKVVIASTTDVPGGKPAGEAGGGVTDTNGNILCKSYA